MQIDGKNAFLICRQEAKKGQGMSRVEAAQAIPISGESLGAYERGETVPPEDVMLRMAQLYEAPWLVVWYMNEYSPSFRWLLGPFKNFGDNLQTDILAICLRSEKIKGVGFEIAEIFEDGSVDCDEEGRFEINMALLLDFARAIIRAKCSTKTKAACTAMQTT